MTCTMKATTFMQYSQITVLALAKDVERIFERFYRTDESRNSKHGGSGILLQLLRRLLRTTKERYGQRV